MVEHFTPEDRRKAADTSATPDWAVVLINDVGEIRDRVSRIEGIGAALVFIVAVVLPLTVAVVGIYIK